MGINDLLNKMEAAENAFLDAEFIAPVLPGGQVRVRIAGIVCTLKVTGRFNPGWAMLKPLSMDSAQVVSEPGLKQIRDYLTLFPAVRLLLVNRLKDGWTALSAHKNDSRFQAENMVRVNLVTDCTPFCQVIARFDGSQFWFESIDRRRNPAIAAFLRDSLAADTPPDQLKKSTLTAEERAAYSILYKAVIEARKDHTELRLEDALAHAGADLTAYIERADAYTVSYCIDGRTYRSTVRKDDLTVVSAGICLSGHDRHFDLQSLVGVIREGRAREEIVHTNDEY